MAGSSSRLLRHGPITGGGLNYHRYRFAKARPAPDLRYFSEFKSAGFVTQADGHDDFPRFELGRVRRLPVVVGGKTGIEVFGNTNVALVGMGDTAEEIDGIHTDALWETENVGKDNAVGQP